MSKEELEVVLMLNPANTAQCKVCGELTNQNGLLFMLAGTQQPLCTECAAKYAPKLKEQYDLAISYGKWIKGEGFNDDELVFLKNAILQLAKTLEEDAAKVSHAGKDELLKTISACAEIIEYKIDPMQTNLLF
jgi:hypothetical protein